jgi:hypothetical protein
MGLWAQLRGGSWEPVATPGVLGVDLTPCGSARHAAAPASLGLSAAIGCQC